MKTSTILILAMAILIGLIIFGSVKTGNTIKEDVFNGVITNIKLEPVVLEGTGVYDRSCNPVENGLTQCDAGIQTENGLLNFNYKHDMHAQPCIDSGDKVKVEILDSNGRAKITRF